MWMQVSPSFPDQLNGCSWRAKLSQHRVMLTACFQTAVPIAFRFQKFGLGLICYFQSGRNVGLHVQNYLAGIYVPPPSYFCSECSSPQWFLLSRSSRASAGILSQNSAPSTLPFSFKVYFTYMQSRKDALTPNTLPTPPKAYVLPSTPLFFSFSGSSLMSYMKNHSLNQSNPFQELSLSFP